MNNPFETKTDKEKIECLERRIKALEADKQLLRTRCKVGAEEAFDRGMYGLLKISKLKLAQVEEVGQDTIECAIFYKCKNCGNEYILQGNKYCSECGMLIDWGV